jgi:hypothetical protein
MNIEWVIFAGSGSAAKVNAAEVRRRKMGVKRIEEGCHRAEEVSVSHFRKKSRNCVARRAAEE